MPLRCWIKLFEYTDANEHVFRKFGAPFSGKAEQAFPERVHFLLIV